MFAGRVLVTRIRPGTAKMSEISGAKPTVRLVVALRRCTRPATPSHSRTRPLWPEGTALVNCSLERGSSGSVPARYSWLSLKPSPSASVKQCGDCVSSEVENLPRVVHAVAVAVLVHPSCDHDHRSLRARGRAAPASHIHAVGGESHEAPAIDGHAPAAAAATNAVATLGLNRSVQRQCPASDQPNGTAAAAAAVVSSAGRTQIGWHEHRAIRSAGVSPSIATPATGAAIRLRAARPRPLPSQAISTNT